MSTDDLSDKTIRLEKGDWQNAESSTPIYEIPFGKMWTRRDGVVTAELSLSARNRTRLLESFDTLFKLSHDVFLPCVGWDEREERARIWWQADAEALPVSQYAEDWRRNPAIALADAIDLARTVMRARGELAAFRTHRFPLSPIQVIGSKDSTYGNAPSSSIKWKVIPLVCTGMDFSDFARLNEMFWMWLSADEIMSTDYCDRSYSMAACLLYMLVGDSYPGDLTRTERFSRLLAYRAGNSATTRRVVSAAVPRSFAGQAQRLASFITNMLGPSLGRTMTPAQAFAELEDIAKQLGIEELAYGWLEEGRIDQAHTLAKKLAARPPSSQASWELVRRIAIVTSDEQLAALAQSHIDDGQDDVGERIIDRIRKALHGASPVKEVAEAFGSLFDSQNPRTLDTAVVNGISGASYLYLTYVVARWLERNEDALEWLKRPQEVTWDRIVVKILIAKLEAEKNDWRRVSKVCAEGAAETERMPNRGSAMGSYARAYLNLLDGIAHLYGVYRQNLNPDYLIDAMDRFQRTWLELSQHPHKELIESLYTWFAFLAEAAGKAPGKGDLRLGILSFLQLTAGLELRRNPGLEPAIPWFDADRIFGLPDPDDR
jgi:hypothetical protein